MIDYKGYKNPRHRTELIERIISTFSYVTSGMVGFVWLIAVNLQKKSLSSFAKYHIYQSIFISILLYVINILLNIIVSVAQIIPFIGVLVTNIVYYLVQYPIIFKYSLVHSTLIITYFYLAYNALLGKYSRLPVISDMVRQMV